MANVWLLTQKTRQVWLVKMPLLQPCKNIPHQLPSVSVQVFDTQAQEPLNDRLVLSEMRAKHTEQQSAFRCLTVPAHYSRRAAFQRPQMEERRSYSMCGAAGSTLALTHLPRTPGCFVPQWSAIKLRKHEIPNLPEDPCSDSDIIWLDPLQLTALAFSLKVSAYRRQIESRAHKLVKTLRSPQVKPTPLLFLIKDIEQILFPPQFW